MSVNELVAALRDGCICHPRRWSGDTHGDLGGTVKEGETDALMREAADKIESLEAVLQQQGEAVAWHTEDHLSDKSATTYDKAVADRWVAKGWPITPMFYTHPPKPVVSDASDDKILWGIVANAGRLSNKRMARWAHVSDATGQGSSSSAELCRRFGFDPDAEVGGDNLDAFLAETEAELVVSDEVQELIVDAFMAGNQRGHESTVEGNWSDDRDIGHEYAVALGVKS